MSTLEMASNCTCPTARLAKPLGSLQSPMTELLGIFGAPSLAECAMVRENILQIATDMSELDNEIGRVKKILERLYQNRVALQKYSERHQNLLNLTRRLPIEILGEIFIQLQDMLGGRSIVPTRVCRHWREVAIGTTRLWSHINIRYRTWRAHEDAEMTSIWLQRSGGQPLNIILGRMDAEHYAGTEKKENPALDALLHNQAHRWNDVKLIVTKSMLSFLKNIPKGLPMLHTLLIDGPENDLGIASLNNFRDASALRVLTLENRVSLKSSQWLPEFPWAQLTTLNLMGGRNHSYTSHDVCIALRKSVNLRYCTMAIRGSLSFATEPPPSILILNLISLDISALLWHNIEDILNVLTLPALTELKIITKQTAAAAVAVPECVAALITRSGCQLQHLSLGTRGALFNHVGLLELLKLTPMLSELELQFSISVSVNDSLMDLLTHKPDHAAGLCCLLPNLASIRLTVHSAFSYETFVDLLSSRHHVAVCSAGGVGLAQLREAVLIAWADVTASGRRAYYLPQETFEGFRELRESGLDLYVIDGGTKRSLEEYFAPGEEEDDFYSEKEEEEEDEEDEGSGDDYHP